MVTIVGGGHRNSGFFTCKKISGSKVAGLNLLGKYLKAVKPRNVFNGQLILYPKTAEAYHV